MQQPEIASVLAALGSADPADADKLVTAQQLIEALPVPVFFKARDGRYLGVNRAWEEFFGVSREQMVGARVHDLFAENPSAAERHHAMDEALWARPGTQAYEIPVAARDGR